MGNVSRTGNAFESEEHRRIPKYSIGVVSRLIGIPPQTLRRYEEAGLLDPARHDGKNRLYSDENLTILQEIAELAEQGINVVGIRYILQMRQQVFSLQQEMLEIRMSLEREYVRINREDNSARK
ncbi:MerR family transcriptional regulator [Tengunoibacter tsumagoiensis]|uniref:HTH merR-type domain-containing protein n=1 Tax=Tengunoibacter tsumagoiensis TaxID=2014871 RepID=A0A401ZYQ3_9CHLR|nr:MerR family transcriptional regulator [Tengunoibacter tsumagoiensis]GCE11986.1 hypothetical protein KTT_18450 [Tengunoibacter tsumagoiensis]